jgi:hypothetical protein
MTGATMMEITPAPPKLFVGVDIAATTATVAWLVPGAKPSLWWLLG